MVETGSITGGSSGAYEGSRVKNKAMEIGTETFLQLLVTQMRYQDPFSGGQDMGDFMSQVAQFTMVERIIKLQQTIEDYTAQLAPVQSLGLLNRVVEVRDQEGEVHRGTVTSIRFEEGNPLLKVNGGEYPLDALLQAEAGNAEE